jgi:hypothetical protein
MLGFSTVKVISSLVGILVIVAFVYYCTVYDAPYIAKKCEKHIMDTVNPDELQQWALTLLKDHPPGTTNVHGPFDAPLYLTKIWEGHRPSVYTREGSANEEPYVYVFWGGGEIGHWGLSIGSPNFIPSDPAHGGERWKSGIYMWEDFR